MVTQQLVFIVTLFCFGTPRCCTADETMMDIDNNIDNNNQNNNNMIFIMENDDVGIDRILSSTVSSMTPSPTFTTVSSSDYPSLSPQPSDAPSDVPSTSPSSLFENNVSPTLEPIIMFDHEPTVFVALSIILPLLGITMIVWMARTNGAIRDQVTACCNGSNYCFDDEIPGEIVVKSKDPVPVDAGNIVKDIELQPVSTFETHSAFQDSTTIVSIRRTMIRNHSWNTLPDDPVDEVSLKGSSFYNSDDEDDSARVDLTTNFVRMNDPLYRDRI